MRCKQAIEYCLTELTKNYTRPLIDVINEYRNMVAEAAEIGYEEAQEAEEEGDGGGGILSELIGRKIEKSNIERNRGKTGKRDLIGQAGCAKNQGGSCSSCNIRRGCSRYWI